jgi:hypothetical protein
MTRTFVVCGAASIILTVSQELKIGSARNHTLLSHSHPLNSITISAEVTLAHSYIPNFNMPPTNHSCILAVTKNLNVRDAEKLCEYFASRLKPIHVEYNGRKGTLHIKWSPNRFIKTFKTLQKCLENVRPITEDSEDVDAVAYAFHSKYVGADTSVDRPHNKPKYPSHVLLELPNGQIYVIPGASGVHTSPDTMWVSQDGVNVDVPSEGVHRTSGSKWTMISTKMYTHSEKWRAQVTTNIRIIPKDGKK